MLRISSVSPSREVVTRGHKRLSTLPSAVQRRRRRKMVAGLCPRGSAERLETVLSSFTHQSPCTVGKCRKLAVDSENLRIFDSERILLRRVALENLCSASVGVDQAMLRPANGGKLFTFWDAEYSFSQVYALTGGLPPIMPTFDIKSLLKKRPASKRNV